MWRHHAAFCAHTDIVSVVPLYSSSRTQRQQNWVIQNIHLCRNLTQITAVTHPCPVLNSRTIRPLNNSYYGQSVFRESWDENGFRGTAMRWLLPQCSHYQCSTMPVRFSFVITNIVPCSNTDIQYRSMIGQCTYFFHTIPFTYQTTLIVFAVGIASILIKGSGVGPQRVGGYTTAAYHTEERTPYDIWNNPVICHCQYHSCKEALRKARR